MSESTKTKSKTGVNSTKRQTKRQLQIDKFTQFAKEFAQESDRAAVILGAAQLDAYLRVLLDAFVLPATTGKDELLDGDGPLGTFSARINAAYRFGLIDAEFANVLHLVRKTRNAFAHDVSGVSLKAGSHRDRVRAISDKFSDDEKYGLLIDEFFNGVNDASTEYRASVALMSIRLELAAVRLKRVDAANCQRLRPADMDS